MADAEITPEEVRGIDINQVASMQLKDGTTVVVQGEGELGYEGEFAQEEVDDGAYEYAAEDVQEQSNQLRARPMVVMAPPRVVRPPVVAPGMVRPGPILAPKPVVVPRGPYRPMGAPVVFRTRPGMPLRPAVVAPRPAVPVRPVGVPVVRPGVAPLRPGVVPMKPVAVPGRPMVVAPKPLVNNMVRAPGVFRARPGYTDAEAEGDFQEEELAEENYCECEDLGESDANQLRTRPLVVRPGVPMRPPVVVAPPRPKVVPVPGRTVVVAPPRGPVPRGPVGAYNTFQPRVFRTRPGFGRPLYPTVMRPPMRPVVGLRPAVVAPPVVPRRGYGLGPVFRSRPRSASYDAQDYAEEVDYQCNTEGCDSNVCTKCGKEF